MNYIKKMTLALMATTTIATSAGAVACAVSEKTDLINNLSHDCNRNINLVHYVKAEEIDNEYFVSFDAHSDAGFSGGYYAVPAYKNHTDFVVKYNVSYEDYIKVANMKNKHGYVVFKNTTMKECDILNHIINNYSPCAVDSIVREDTDLVHTCNI